MGVIMNPKERIALLVKQLNQANVEYYKNEAEEANDKVVALESVLDNLRAKGLDIGYANE